MKDEIKTILEKLEFTEKKTDLWEKKIGKDYAYWDFRKILNGRFYVSLNGKDFESADLSKKREEYIDFRKLQGGDGGKIENDISTAKPTIVQPNNNTEIVLRGNETEISNVVKSRRLDMIAKVAKDNLGEGILYHNLGPKIGFEPSAELVDMITADMGNIETTLTEHGMNRHIDPDGNEYNTYYAIVQAKDTLSGTVGYGSAEQVIDYEEMKKNGRCFSLTLAIRKAERNAKQRLIPVPRKAMVELVKDLIKKNKGGNGK